MLYKGFRNLIQDSQDAAEIKDIWLATNKGSVPLEVGDRGKGYYRFPGCWTIKDYGINRTMFWIAMLFEILFLALIFTQAGVQLFLVITALISVIIDFISALAHTSKRKEITMERLELNALKYLRSLHDPQATDPKIREAAAVVKKYENNVWRIVGIVLIVVSWLAKIFVTTVTFGLPIIILASVVIFGFVAYIHLYHTGYFFLGARFYSKLDKIAIRDGNQNFTGRNTDDDFVYFNLDKIENVTLFEIKHKVNNINIEVYDSLVKKDDGYWSIKKWKHHFWDDEDAENFIKSSDDQNNSLTPDAQAYLLYKIYENMFKQQMK